MTRRPFPRAGARRLRRLAGLGVLIAPTLWVVGTDFLRRARYILAFDGDKGPTATWEPPVDPMRGAPRFGLSPALEAFVTANAHRLGYLASIVESLLFWGVLLHVASRRRGAVQKATSGLFLVLFTLAAGVEGAFHAFYNVYLSMDGQLHSKSIPWSIIGTLPPWKPFFIAHLLAAFGIAMILLRLGQRYVRPRNWPRRITPLLVPVVLVAVFKIPVSYRTLQSTTFDMIYFHGIAAVVKEHLGFTHDSPDLRVQRRSPEPVPALSAKPSRPRNVLMIVQESQRADVTCMEYEPDCALATRSSNAAVPNRMPLLQLRANASTTAISISNLWSGVRPTEGREMLHSVPLLWDYARAAGYDTAYWTSQNLMFGNARLYVQDIPVSHRCVATELDTQADLDAGALDAHVSDRVIKDWSELKEPFFGVVHYSNIHWPYVYDEDHAPFQPADLDKSPEKNEEFMNYYKDVVYLSDLAVGKLLRHIRGTESGKRTVIVYTSDHGEAFREHWQLGHTSALYEEEIHVPGWVDAPEGTLAPEEEASLRAAKDDLVWHLDIAPTFLDLMGIWDDPALTPFRARMMGHPLTRPERTVEPVPLTNCTWLWECAFRNWGIMQGPMKLHAREWDGEYHCFNVLEDPGEQHNLGEQACAPLPDLARSLYHVMPNVTPPGRPTVNWGKK